jgi:hypothetical protein
MLGSETTLTATVPLFPFMGEFLGRLRGDLLIGDGTVDNPHSLLPPVVVSCSG